MTSTQERVKFEQYGLFMTKGAQDKGQNQKALESKKLGGMATMDGDQEIEIQSQILENCLGKTIESIEVLDEEFIMLWFDDGSSLEIQKDKDQTYFNFSYVD